MLKSEAKRKKEGHTVTGIQPGVSGLVGDGVVGVERGDGGVIRRAVSRAEQVRQEGSHQWAFFRLSDS